MSISDSGGNKSLLEHAYRRYVMFLTPQLKKVVSFPPRTSDRPCYIRSRKAESPQPALSHLGSSITENHPTAVTVSFFASSRPFARLLVWRPVRAILWGYFPTIFMQHAGVIRVHTWYACIRSTFPPFLSGVLALTQNPLQPGAAYHPQTRSEFSVFFHGVSPCLDAATTSHTALESLCHLSPDCYQTCSVARH